jgi:hypothetical protein
VALQNVVDQSQALRSMIAEGAAVDTDSSCPILAISRERHTSGVIARKLLIVFFKVGLLDANAGLPTNGDGALNIRAFSVQKRFLLAFHVQIRGERSRLQSFPIRRFG